MLQPLKIVSLTTFLLLLSFKGYCQSDEATVNAYRCFQFFIDYEYEDTLKARVYSDSSVYWAAQTGQDALMGDAMRLKGWYYHDRGKFDVAIMHYYKSLNYMQKADQDQGVADAYGNLGNAYYDKGDLQQSLNMQLKSLKVNDKVLDRSKDAEERQMADEGKAIAMHNIADIYGEIALYSKAFEYAFRGLSHDLEVNDTMGMAISFNSIATLHKQAGNTDSSEYYFKKAIHLYRLYPQPYEYGNSLIEYATLEGASLSKRERSEMAAESLRLRRGMGDSDSEASTLIQISTFFFDDLSLDSLSAMLERAYFLIESGGIEDLSSDYFRVYSKYSSRIGDYKEAFFALEDYLELKTIADEEQHYHDLIAGGLRYQIEHEFRQDSLRQEYNFTQERNKYLEDISEIQNIVYLSIIGFILLVASLFYYVTSNRRRKRMNGILMEKNQLVQEQKTIVEEKNRSISDSINYARRLQAAILPTPEQINEYLPNSFLMFRPKDVVSGDFYWFETSGDWCFLAVADCTGHGVPGAMVSVVCSNALNRSVNEFDLIRPKDILDKTREIVIETFAKSGERVSDGMDVSLIAIHVQERRIVFSGAQNGLWLIRDNKELDESTSDLKTLKGESCSLIEWKGDKQPVGTFYDMKSFAETEISLKSGDKLYLMSDGYADQFGGPKGKKFKYVQLKRLLLSNCGSSMEDQKKELVNGFEHWKGEGEQIDDVCIIGLHL